MADDTEEEWEWLIAGQSAPWLTVSVGAEPSALAFLQDPTHEAMFQALLQEYENRFRGGEKYAVFAALTCCVMWRRPLPSWLSKELWHAYCLYCNGQLRSWDEVFGKPFPGKRRKGIDTRAKDVAVWARVRQLYKTEDYKLEDELWERVGKEFKMGTTNVKAAFGRMERQSKAAGSPFKLQRKPRRRRRK